MFPINHQSHQHIVEVARTVAVEVAADEAVAVVRDHVRHDRAAMVVVVRAPIHDDPIHVRDLDQVHLAARIIVAVGVAQTIARAAIITEWVNSIDQIISEISKIVVEIVGIVVAMVGEIVAIAISVTTVVNDVSIVDRLHIVQIENEALIDVHRLHCRQVVSHHRHRKKIHSLVRAVNRASKRLNECWRKIRRKNKRK